MDDERQPERVAHHGRLGVPADHLDRGDLAVHPDRSHVAVCPDGGVAVWRLDPPVPETVLRTPAAGRV